MDSKDVYQDWKSQSVAASRLPTGNSVPVCTPRMAASPSQFLIIVGLFTRYIGTAPELESADRCRAQGLRGFSSLTLRQANLPKPVLVTLGG